MAETSILLNVYYITFKFKKYETKKFIIRYNDRLCVRCLF